MLIALIVICEVGFWVVLVLGLSARYVFKKPRLGAFLLMCVPLLDLLLVAASAIDLQRGATADFAHGLAAAYIGFTIAFGHDLVKWADAKFALRYGQGDSSPKLELVGWEHAKKEWKLWFKGLYASAIAAVLLLAAIWYVDDASRTESLVEWFSVLAGLLGIWLLLWPLWYTLFPKKVS